MDDFFTDRAGTLEVSDICARFHRGNTQSVAANPGESAKQRDRNTILKLLRENPMTCDEVEVETGLSHQTCSARFSELKRDKEIHQVGTRRTRSGSTAGVWEVIV